MWIKDSESSLLTHVIHPTFHFRLRSLRDIWDWLVMLMHAFFVWNIGKKHTYVGRAIILVLNADSAQVVATRTNLILGN